MTSHAPDWLVTGSSRGLGNALVKAILASGQRVIATLRNPSMLSELQKEFPDSQLLFARLDVTNVDEIDAVFELKAHFNRLDVVVNNAGHTVFGQVEAVPDDAARQNFEVQFWGPVNITKKAIAVFREVDPKGQGGRVINISSIGGFMGAPGLGFYSASKFTLEGFTEAFSKEMRPDWNIKGMIIELSGFKSDTTRSSIPTFLEHPAYAGPANPSSDQTPDPDDENPTGVAEKMAQAIISTAAEPNPPFHLQLGSDSWAMMRNRAQTTIRDGDEWAHISHSTNREGLDGVAHADMILQALSRCRLKRL